MQGSQGTVVYIERNKQDKQNWHGQGIGKKNQSVKSKTDKTLEKEPQASEYLGLGFYSMC